MASEERKHKADGKIIADEFLRSVLGEDSFTAPVKRRKRPKQQIGVSTTDMQDGGMDENMAVGPSSKTWLHADILRKIARTQATPKNAERSEIDDLLPISVRVPSGVMTKDSWRFFDSTASSGTSDHAEKAWAAQARMGAHRGCQSGDGER